MIKFFFAFRSKVYGILVAAFLLNSFSMMAQSAYPVDAYIALGPAPQSSYLADYIAMGSNLFTLNVTFKDFSEPSYQVRMKVTITKGGFSITTSETYWSTHFITLYPGMNSFTGADLSGYFNVNNMAISGGNAETIRRTKSIPEGDYDICVEVYDHRANKLLARTSCTRANVRKNYPPTMVNPRNNQAFSVTDFSHMYMYFSWFNMGYMFPVVYDFKLVEVPQGITTLNAMNATLQPVLSETDIMLTNFYYGPSAPPLVDGKTYAWQVRVRSVSGDVIFENDGYSPVWVFTYAFQQKGKIALTGPEDRAEFIPEDPITLSWQPSDFNPGQHVQYHVEVLGLYEGGDSKVTEVFTNAEANHELNRSGGYSRNQTNNRFWERKLLPIADASLPQTFEITSAIPAAVPAFRQFAWRIVALGDDRGVNKPELAVSPTRIFFVEPKREYFFIDDRKVTVTNLTSETINNWTGTGMVKVDKNLGEESEASFSGLKMQIIDGEYHVVNGRLHGKYDRRFEMKTENGDESYLVTDSFNIRKTYDQYRKESTFSVDLAGAIFWEYPLAIAGGDIGILRTDLTTFDYTNATLKKYVDVYDNTPTGHGYVQRPTAVGIKEEQEFVLVDPVNFSVKYALGSRFMVKDDSVFLSLNGSVSYTGTENTPPLSLSFANANNPYYFSNGLSFSNLTSNEWQLNEFITVTPGATVFDFSETQSLGGLSETWKGIFFNTYSIENGGSTNIFDANIRSGAWLGTHGLDLSVDEKYSPARQFNYKGFDATEDSLVLSFREGAMTGSIGGGVKIPVLNKTLGFFMSIDNEGLNTLVVDHSLLADAKITINPDDNEEKVELTVKQGVIHDNFLDMSVRVAWPANNIDIDNINNFRIWQDGNIGFNTINGSYALSQQIAGKAFGDYDITIDSITACRRTTTHETTDRYYRTTTSTVNNIVIGFSSTIVISDDIAGPSGDDPTRIHIVSQGPVAGDSPPPPAAETPQNYYTETDWGNELTSQTVYMYMLIPEIAEAKGSLTLTKNDPVYGNSFQGNLTIAMAAPVTKTVNSKLIVGRKKDGETPYSYWFFEATLAGLDKPMGFVTFTGFTGRVFHHMMSPAPNCEDFDEASSAGGSYVPNPDVSYGGGFAVSFKDTKTAGKSVQGSGDLNMAFNQSGGLENIKVVLNGMFGNEKTSYNSNVAAVASCMATASGCFAYSKEDNTFTASLTAKVKGKTGICGDAYFYLSSSDSRGLSYKIGSPDNMIQLTFNASFNRYTCSGPTIWTYLTYDEKEPETNSFLGAKFPKTDDDGNFIYETVDKYRFGLASGSSYTVYSPTISAFGYSAWAQAYAYWYVLARGELAENKLQNIGVYVEIGAGIDVYYDGWIDSGHFPLFDITLSGDLTYYVQIPKITGELKARIGFLGLGHITTRYGFSQHL